MVELLIVADDFTGALDTGVQLAKKGIVVLVTVFESLNELVPEGVRVLSVDLETRHMSPSKAYDRVLSAAVFAKEHGIEHVYKKIDSTLRGNIGAELSALIDAFNGRPVALIPAYPAAGRTTRGGYQLVHGVALDKTQFASDILNPVTDSYIPHIISAQCKKRVMLANTESVMAEEKDTIYVLDAETEAQLANIGKGLRTNGFSGLLSGCAGFAEYLTELFDIRTDAARYNSGVQRKAGVQGKATAESKESAVQDESAVQNEAAAKNNALIKNNAAFQKELTVEKGNVLIVSGSVNRVSTDQCEFAFKQGVPGAILTPRQKMQNGYWDSQEGENDIADYVRQCKRAGAFIIGCGTNSEQPHDPALPPGVEGEFVAGQISRVVEKLVNQADISVLVIFGGDTAAAIMNRLGVSGIIPVAELFPGIVLSKFSALSKQMYLVTKAGGFGPPDTIAKIVGHMSTVMNESAGDGLAGKK